MIPNSLVKRLSKTLVSRRSNASEEGERSKKDEGTSSSDGTATTLRRQSTKHLSSEDESQSKGKVTSRSSVTTIRTSSVVREVSKTRTAAASFGSQKLSKRLSKPPSRLVEEEEEPSPKRGITLTKSPSKQSWPKAPSRSSSLSKSPSRERALSKTPSLSRSGSKGSMNRSASKGSVSRSTSKGSMSRSASKGSMSRSGSKGSMTKKGSVEAAVPRTPKKKPGGKELWFDAGAYLTVRNEEGGFYICRAVNNIYNTTKTAKVRWLGPKTGKPKKRGGRKRVSGPANPVADNVYELMYPDQVDPTTVLMEVEVDRKGTSYWLNEADKKETERLMQVAQDVESGKMNKGDIGDDVDEAVQVDYEPPVKRRKLQAGASPVSKSRKSSVSKSKTTKEKKPRLKKTMSQKEREKAKKAKEREDKKEQKKKAAEERKRKKAVKEDDTTLKPNPAVKILDKDPLWETNTYMPYVSKFSNAKLAFRAVQLGDIKMLKKLLKDADRIYNLDHYRCPMMQKTPLEFAIKLGNKEAIDLLIEDYFGSKFSKRTQEGHADKMLLSKLGTGTYNYRSLGVGRIRPLMASRGAREGNNALIKDENDQSSGSCMSEEDFLERVLVDGASVDLVMKAMNEMKDPKDNVFHSFGHSEMYTFVSRLPTILARGHNQAAGQVMKVMQNHRQYSRVPAPLWKVLVAKDVSEVPSVPPSSMDLNMKSIKGFTMLHAAASNPNPDVLEKVLTSDPNFLVSDIKGRRPVHIAAGCSSTAPLQLLLDRGANPYDADADRETALHYAIRAGRTKNVAILLNMLSDSKSRVVDPTAGKPNGGVNRTNKRSYGPLHMACQAGHLDMVKLLVKHGANVNMKTSLNDLSVTPLMHAAGIGNLDIVKCLVNAGAVVELSDRVGRTALMHAAMNGSTRVMSYLLHIGAWPNRKDTSGNTPLHYAAAYGWYFSVKLLLESGADPAVSNDWTTTPLSVAYLKGHQGVVSVLLEDDRVDVNFPNEDGETLLFIACSSEKEEDLEDQIRYLIKEKGADCTITNNTGGTPLHCLADTRVYKEGFYMEKEEKILTKPDFDETVIRVVMEIAKMLVEGGCDVTLRDGAGYTPAMRALKQGNTKLAQYLVEKGSLIFSRVSEDEDTQSDTILHHAAEQLFNTFCGDANNIINFLTKTWTVKGEKRSFRKELKEMAQIFNKAGSTPLLTACAHYSSNSFDDSKMLKERETWKWECAFTFIQNLIDVAESDVNMTNKPRWRAFGERQADENEGGDYANSRQARWSPVFYMVEAKDPTFTAQHKHDPNDQGWGLKYILSQGADVNVCDLNGHTPFTYALETRKKAAILHILIKEGEADVNQCRDIKVIKIEEGERWEYTYSIPPICLAADSGHYELVEELLKFKVDVNATNNQFETNVLHILAEKHRHQAPLPLMKKLLEAGLDPNTTNKDERTPLHLLVNNNAGRIDDSFEEEVLLISNKADLSLRDCEGRVPLHYVFVKTGREEDKSQLDPVDLCKLLVKSMKAADLNIADKAGRTPLHYAAQRNASICCMYLMQKGANPNVKDKNGNTPLNLAVMAKHDSCGSVLIQNGADLKTPVVVGTAQGKEDTDKRPPEWKWKPLTAVKKTVEAREVPLFQEAIKQGLVGVSFLILEWPVEKSGVTLIDAIEMAVKNSQFNVALRLLSTVMKGSGEVCAVREQNRNMLHMLALHANPDNNPQQQIKVAETLREKGVSATAKDKYGCTPLLYAANNKNWTLATHFADLPGVLNVKYTDGFNRNLVAASMWKCFFAGLHRGLWPWLEKLLTKKIDINCHFDYPLPMDVFGSKSLRSGGLEDPDYWRKYPGHQTTPLIFALHCKDFGFTFNLLKSGASPNLTDGESLTPLMHAVKLNSVKHVKQLLKYDYNPDVDDKPLPPSQPQKKQKKKKTVKKNVFRLTKRASDVPDMDSDSSSSSEEEEEVAKKAAAKKEFRAIAKTSSVNLNATDKNGWTALHFAACPLDMGTYDNEELVFVLGKAGAKLDVRNSDGQTPLDLALASSASKVAAMLQTLMGVDKKRQKEPVITPADHRVSDGVLRRKDYDFHGDADKQLAGGEEEMEEEEPFEPEVSAHCNITNGTIAKDEEQDLPYEVLMTKCDAHLGVWGLYNFYQIQLVHQPGQNLYVLFTRWGRIGDQGQFQHTPFSSKEAGVKEFCKIFRAKSGNKWQDVKSFEQKPRKYRLVPAEERRPPKAQKKIEFDFSTGTSCTMPEHIRSAMKIMVNVETLQRSYQSDVNVDTNVLPFGRFHRDRLLQAKQLLEEMGTLVYNIAEHRKDPKNKTPAQKEQHQLDCQKVSELSSDYYQLIPQKNFVYEQLRPLDRMNDFQNEFRLITNLLDFEVSTKMMLGAMFRKSEVHPLDYVYNVMRCKLERMDEEGPMTQNILRFAQLGASDSKRFEGVYKVERDGEEARFQKCGLSNRRLLWHGTRSCNLVSILNRGLVSTPLDANMTGQRFGKGIYFSDLMSKSDTYTDTSRDASSFMLLCEVALGKQRIVGDDSNEAKRSDAEDVNSSIALGHNFPDPDYDIHLPSGEVMCLGDSKYQYNYETASGEIRRRTTYHNEYIVYHENQACIRYLLQYRNK